MTLAAIQVRQACVLLRWNSPTLSRRAKVSYDAARKARTDEGMPTLSFLDVRAIRVALEKAGVQFGVDIEGRPSAVLVKVEP